MKTLTAVIICFSFTHSVWAQLEEFSKEAPVDYVNSPKKDSKLPSHISQGCQSKDVDGLKHPTLIEAVGVCQLYMITKDIRIVGDLRIAEGQPNKCLSISTKPIDVGGGLEFIIVLNDSFPEVRQALAINFSNQLNPISSGKTTLPEHGIYYDIYNGSDKKVSTDSTGNTIVYDNRTEAVQAMKSLEICRRPPIKSVPMHQVGKEAVKVPPGAIANPLLFDGLTGAATR